MIKMEKKNKLKKLKKVEINPKTFYVIRKNYSIDF